MLWHGSSVTAGAVHGNRSRSQQCTGYQISVHMSPPSHCQPLSRSPVYNLCTNTLVTSQHHLLHPLQQSEHSINLTISLVLFLLVAVGRSEQIAFVKSSNVLKILCYCPLDILSTHFANIHPSVTVVQGIAVVPGRYSDKYSVLLQPVVQLTRTKMYVVNIMLNM